VKKDPVLYQGVHEIWKGKAANVSVTDNETTFYFLIDYAPGKATLGGMAFVKFNQAIQLNPERQLEALVRVMPPGADGIMNLEGIAIYQSGKLEQ
jgi:hypothetical protein